MHAKRHPIFEGLVFGLAALLALVIFGAVSERLYERYEAGHQAGADVAPSQGVPMDSAAAGANTLVGSPTEEVPASLPSASISAGAPRQAAPDVPAPGR